MSVAPCHISGTLNFEVALDLYKICVPLRRNSKKKLKISRAKSCFDTTLLVVQGVYQFCIQHKNIIQYHKQYSTY
jgi:hypothetical protein